MDSTLSSDVLHSPELRDLILEALVKSIRCFSDVPRVLRFLTLCQVWRAASATVRAAIKDHWKMSSHAHLRYDDDHDYEDLSL